MRFIAVNDNVDSANGGMDNDFTPLRNLFNEWLVRDTSKKIKAVKKAKGMSGKPVTSKSTVKRAIEDLKRCGNISVERRYRKNGANSSLLFVLKDFSKHHTTTG